MSRVGRVVNDIVVDVIDGVTVAQAEAMFASDIVSQWNSASEGFVNIPSDIKNGATHDNGAYTNRAPVVATLSPVDLSRIEFKDYCYDQLEQVNSSTRLQAVARFGEIISDGNASTDHGVLAAMDRYNDVDTIDKESCVEFFAMLLAQSIITQAENDGVLDNWPERY